MSSIKHLLILQERISARCQVENKTFKLLIAAFVAGLPVLIEDVPGVGKTSFARALAATCNLDFGRIQGAPDLLPSDILGMSVWSMESRTFVYKEGPIMHQIVLVDELNRASTRTQAALLEAMEEGQVSIEGKSYSLPQPFFLIATQNPSHFAGTYHLPEAQLDRFGIQVRMGYPSNEAQVLKLNIEGLSPGIVQDTKTAVHSEIISTIRGEVGSIGVAEVVYDYVSRVLTASRKNNRIALGLSPRGGIHWLRMAQALAWMDGRNFVIPEDLLFCAVEVLAHRLTPSPEFRLEGMGLEKLVEEMVERVPVPNGVS